MEGNTVNVATVCHCFNFYTITRVDVFTYVSWRCVES